MGELTDKQKRELDLQIIHGDAWKDVEAGDPPDPPKGLFGDD